MTYALGALPYDSWCTSSHIPSANCRPIRGVAIPLTAVTLAVYKDLQTKVNALLAKAGSALIRVDGRPGSGTQAGLLKATRYARGLGLAPPTPISTYVVANQTIPLDVIAKYADEINAGLDQSIARIGAVYVPPPATSKPSQPTAGGGVANPPMSVIAAEAGGGFLGSLGVPLPLAAVAGVLVVLAARKAMKGGGRKRSRRRR